MRSCDITPEQDLIYQGKRCAYCHKETVLRNSRYGPTWNCDSCGAYVGCHDGTTIAKGRVANVELRKAKIDAHNHFDQIWKLGFMERKQAYRWLQDQLNIPKEYCHIGMFNEKTCARVSMLVTQYLEKKGRKKTSNTLAPRSEKT